MRKCKHQLESAPHLGEKVEICRKCDTAFLEVNPTIKKLNTEPHLEALPVLLLGSMMGNDQSSKLAGRIIGTTLADAMKPSFDALNRLRTGRH